MARRGHERGRVLGLGEQWEAGRGDGGALTQLYVRGNRARGCRGLWAHCGLPGWIEGLG